MNRRRVSLLNVRNPEVSSPPIPTVAIASGECIYIYRYLRPYLKFTMPQVELDPQEVDIWAELVRGELLLTTLPLIFFSTVRLLQAVSLFCV